MKTLITIAMLLIYCSADAQCDLDKKYGFTHNPDTAAVTLLITAWGQPTPIDLSGYYQKHLPESDFNCIVNNAYAGRKYDLVLVVLHKEKRFKTRKQSFDFDVFRALVYQK